jgi:hypothetical protein
MPTADEIREGEARGRLWQASWTTRCGVGGFRMPTCSHTLHVSPWSPESAKLMEKLLKRGTREGVNLSLIVDAEFDPKRVTGTPKLAVAREKKVYKDAAERRKHEMDPPFDYYSPDTGSVQMMEDLLGPENPGDAKFGKGKTSGVTREDLAPAAVKLTQVADGSLSAALQQQQQRRKFARAADDWTLPVLGSQMDPSCDSLRGNIPSSTCAALMNISDLTIELAMKVTPEKARMTNERGNHRNFVLSQIRPTPTCVQQQLRHIWSKKVYRHAVNFYAMQDYGKMIFKQRLKPFASLSKNVLGLQTAEQFAALGDLDKANVLQHCIVTAPVCNKSIVLFRGQAGGFQWDEPAVLKRGFWVSDRIFSTSVDADKATNFGSTVDPTFLVYHVDAGVPYLIMPATGHSEQEVLLPSGVMMTILSDTKRPLSSAAQDGDAEKHRLLEVRVSKPPNRRDIFMTLAPKRSEAEQQREISRLGKMEAPVPVQQTAAEGSLSAALQQAAKKPPKEAKTEHAVEATRVIDLVDPDEPKPAKKPQKPAAKQPPVAAPDVIATEEQKPKPKARKPRKPVKRPGYGEMKRLRVATSEEAGDLLEDAEALQQHADAETFMAKLPLVDRDAPCPPDMKRDRDGRCIFVNWEDIARIYKLPVATKKTKKPCPDGQMRSRVTGECFVFKNSKQRLPKSKPVKPTGLPRLNKKDKAMLESISPVVAASGNPDGDIDFAHLLRVLAQPIK